MQKYKEINGNDYVKDSRTTINETMQSIQSMNSGTAFPTNNLFEGMKCYRTDLKKTYTLTDVANNTWVEDSHATLADEATHADSATKATNDKNGADITATYLKKAGDTATGDITAPNFKGNLSGNADTASKLSTARKISITGNASGNTTFDGSGDISINTTVNESKHAVNADKASMLQTTDGNGAIDNGKFYWVGKDGQPMWLWGSNTKPSETYVYNPSHFHVAAADSDGNGANIANTYLKKATVIDVIYPVGSIYMSMSATNPHDLFGVGTWKRISRGRMLLGADDSTYKAGATGGEAAHTLSVNEMPEHSHTGTTSTNGEHSHSASWLYAWGGSDTWNYFAKSYSDRPGRASGGSFTIDNAGNHNHTFTTNNTGGGAAHNNMPPYLVCYIWQRTA